MASTQLIAVKKTAKVASLAWRPPTQAASRARSSAATPTLTGAKTMCAPATSRSMFSTIITLRKMAAAAARPVAAATPAPSRPRIRLDRHRKQRRALLGLRLRLDRPVDHAAEIDDRNLQDDQQENGFPDHPVSVRDARIGTAAGNSHLPGRDRSFGPQILLQPLQQFAQERELPSAEAGPQAAVEVDRRVEQLLIDRSAFLGRFDAHCAPVGDTAGPRDQACPLEGVEMPGQRRALDSERQSQIVLRSPPVALEGAENQPGRE